MEIRTELILFAKDFPVEDVFNEIGIDIGHIDISEEKVYTTIAGEEFRKEQEYSITYSTHGVDTIRVVDVLDEMCNLLREKVHIIKSVVDKYNLKTKMCLTLNLTDEPEIIFTHEFIRFAAILGCNIEVDSYLDIEKNIEYDESDLQQNDNSVC